MIWIKFKIISFFYRNMYNSEFLLRKINQTVCKTIRAILTVQYYKKS